MVFQLDEVGAPSEAKHYSSLGETPRSFCITGDGTLLLLAHMHSHDVLSFLIDPATGALIPTGYHVDVPYASCVKAHPNDVPIAMAAAE